MKSLRNMLPTHLSLQEYLVMHELADPKKTGNGRAILRVDNMPYLGDDEEG